MKESKTIRIYNEYLRIGSYYEGIDEIRFAMLFPLIRNAAFMRITLDDLADLINENGPIETYQNGENQHGMKQSAGLQSYNTTVKNYAAVIKQLFSMLPRKSGISTVEEWNRKRMPAEDLEKLLAVEREEEQRKAAEWLEKLKRAYGELSGEAIPEDTN